MRVLIRKNSVNGYDVSIRRTRREEKQPAPQNNVSRDKLSETLAKMVKETRGEPVEP